MTLYILIISFYIRAAIRKKERNENEKNNKIPITRLQFISLIKK